MKAPKKVYVCSECDAQFPKWLGRCTSCGAWNTLEEETYSPPQAEPQVNRGLSSKTPSRSVSVVSSEDARATPFTELELPSYMRSLTGTSELDRVLGGGLVDGSAVLLAGEPGIGKSTILMQLCGNMGREDGGNKKLLYVSGEESRGQLKLRAQRLGVSGEGMYVLIETDLDSVIAEYERLAPDVMIIDSIQTMYCSRISSVPGSIAQVKECTLAFISRAKTDGVAVIMVGHVNKEGGIAGPKVLEHMVDAVLYFEGERHQSHRIIRATKNRYGSTNEIGVFEMTDEGLYEITNPSEMLLAGRPKGVPGNCAVCVMEGTRPIVAEIQALVTQTVFPSPRRTSNGIDYNRMCLILAVLEKRLGLKFGACDAYLNVIGGLRLEDPGADLAVALALVSSLRDAEVPDDLIAMGEIGLSGECRAVSGIEQRAKEAAKLGFTKIMIPERTTEKKPLKIEGAEIIPIKGIYDAVRMLRPTREV